MQHSFFDGYSSTVQGLLDWFEVDVGFHQGFFIFLYWAESFLSGCLEIKLGLNEALIVLMGTVAPYRVCSTGFR